MNCFHNIKNNISCYGSYISENHCLIYSFRNADSLRSTNYTQEQTNLYDIKKNTYENIFRFNTISHNFSVQKIDNIYIGIGGVSQLPNQAIHSCFQKSNYMFGLYLMISKELKKWLNPQLIINRNWGLKNEYCIFDSQPCLLYDEVQKLYLLYVRWNPAKQVRKIQVFSTSDINNWTNNAKAVIIDKDINIYTQYIFKHKDKFIGVLRYYKPGNHDKFKKGNHDICIIESNDGISFHIKNEQIIKDYEFFTHGDITQGHKLVNGNPVIFLLTQNGNIMEYEISI